MEKFSSKNFQFSFGIFFPENIYQLEKPPHLRQFYEQRTIPSQSVEESILKICI